METAVAARRWADVLRAAWPAGDVDAFLALYAPDATFRGPFGDPERAQDHMRASLSLGEGPAEAWVGEPLVSGDRAAVEWWAVLRFDGVPTSFAATAWLRFDDDGLVVEEHDYWQSTSSRVEPWSSWDRRAT
jgi:ketosteroid isomerase-like protein